ncbi:MAG: AraC family transcriptional regulator [Winogradskyella sp.]|uniref:AraC family transcriptional regulator n=1 Tax=Winogradskyella sp. TaxID=1883156 RepID=UPI000F3D993D|nr:helix-turn-helix domain-containing protein [Winogradskyella sp.]RNC87852.1 MAG: AraC family transcriptional regulator [Winogradskyella sp.]
MKLDIWSILIIVIAFQGLFLLLMILSNRKIRIKRENTFLVWIVVVLIWFLVEFFCIRNKVNFKLNIFYGTRYGSWFLLGPLTYFYFKSITNSDWRFTRKQLLHFLPFIVFVILIPLISYKALNNRQIDYGMLSVFDHREKQLAIIQWIYSIVFVLQFVHLAFFLFKNLSLVRLYSKGLQKEYSVINTKIKWLKYFNLIMLVVLLLSAIFLYILLVTDIYRRHLDYIYVLPIGILFYFISFKFFRTEWEEVETMTKYSGSTLKADKITEYKKAIDNLMIDKKLYLEPNLRLHDFAEKLDISKHHLSQIINQHYGVSFFDFVNQHRINEAKTIITNHPEYTLLQVAFDSGFNNKTSFVNAFKKFDSITPSKYRDRISI